MGNAVVANKLYSLTIGMDVAVTASYLISTVGSNYTAIACNKLSDTPLYALADESGVYLGSHYFSFENDICLCMEFASKDENNYLIAGFSSGKIRVFNSEKGYLIVC